MTHMESLKSTERNIDDDEGGSNGSDGSLTSESISNKDGEVQDGRRAFVP